MRIVYLIALLGGFGLLTGNGIFGREFFGSRRRVDVPPSVRQTPGGWRTYLHNHGFRGGK